MITDDSFKLHLLLSCLRITCQYFKDDERLCKLSEEYEGIEEPLYHVTCNCDGNINRCDLPDKFQNCLI